MSNTDNEKSIPSPVLQTIVLADHVYVDALTQKKVIAGTFSRLWSPQFPAKLDRNTGAYLVLANCHGQLRLQIRYVDLQDESVLMKSSELVIQTGDPLQTHEVVMEVPPFPMPHEGQYIFEVYCNGNQIGGIRLIVEKIKAPKE